MLNNKPVLIIISLAISLSLWLYVTGQVDPETKAKVNNIPVSIENEEQLAVQDLAVVWDDDMFTTATLQGKRSYVNKAKKSGVKAYVDVSEAKEGVNELNLEFETPTGVTVEGASEAVFNVTVEERISKEVPVKVTFSGVGSDTELVPCATEIYPNEITVSGAKSSVDSTENVEAVIATPDVTETAKNIEADVAGRSKEGAVVEGLDFSRDSVMATVKLMEMKDVSVEYERKSLIKGLEATAVSGPKTVTVLGDAQYLASIDTITATVELTDVRDAGVVEREISFELPYGIYLKDEITENAKVTVIETKED